MRTLPAVLLGALLLLLSALPAAAQICGNASAPCAPQVFGTPCSTGCACGNYNLTGTCVCLQAGTSALCPSSAYQGPAANDRGLIATALLLIGTGLFLARKRPTIGQSD
jgi:hypothetical protein